MKKALLIICLFFHSFAFATTIEGWNIQINNIQLHEKFFISEDMETYTGDMIVSELEKKPTQNHVFVQVDLTVQKAEADNNTFNSNELLLQVNGNTYPRLVDDTFLSDYNIKPFTRLKIKKGTHSGTVLFEIPFDMQNKEKNIVYKQKKLD